MPAISSYEKEKYPETSELINPGSWELIEAHIHKNGEQRSLGTKILAFAVYESLSTPYLTYEFLILDTDNLPSRLPMEGGEKITFEVKDCYGHSRKFDCHLIKITDRTPASPSSMTYTIHAASRHMVRSHFTKISKSFINKKPEEITNSILEELDFNGTFNWYETELPICCMIPNWRPMHAIKWVASRSNASRFLQSPYTVFEDITGSIYQVPIDFLYSSMNVTKGPMHILWNRSSIDEREMRIANDPRMQRHQYTFTDFNIVKMSDLLENLQNGMYANRVEEIDFIGRTRQSKYFNYFDEFKNSEHLGPKPFAIDPEFKLPEVNDATPHWRSVMKHDGLFSQENVESKADRFLGAYTSKSQQTANLVALGTVPGSHELRVGQKYTLNIPLQINGNELQEKDPRLSGDWIIENIKHEFTSNSQYFARLQMFRDAVS